MKNEIKAKLNKLESKVLYPFIGSFIEYSTREECLVNGGMFVNSDGEEEYYYRDGSRCYPENFPQSKDIIQMIIFRNPNKKENEKRN